MLVLDLFSGIGGFSLGLESTGGFTTGAFVELDPYCRRVLQKHWPNVPIYDDIRKVSIPPNSFDVITGGFPCQDVSVAGWNNATQESILGERSGLWWEFYRLISEGKPKWVIIENVGALHSRGLSQILYLLAGLGYDAEWHYLYASSVGLPHTRQRLFIVANTAGIRLEGNGSLPIPRLQRTSEGSNSRLLADFLARPDLPEPWLLRSPNGVPSGVDRLRVIGNSVVPGLVRTIGLSILKAESKDVSVYSG